MAQPMWLVHHVPQSESARLNVISFHETLFLVSEAADAIEGECEAAAPPVRIETSPGLHTMPGLKRAYAICWNAIFLRRSFAGQ